jgi:hypothetical protein
MNPRLGRPSFSSRCALFFACCFGLLFFGASRTASAFALNNYVWPAGSEIQMHLQLTKTQVPLQDGFASWNASAADALAIWNQTLHTVQFVEAAPGSAFGRDHKNSAFFSSTLYGESFPTGVLAVTLNFSEEDSGVFTEADVIFNDHINWNSYRGPSQGSGSGGLYDFHRVALHEFGHVLGLAHPDDAGQNVLALMNSIITNLDHLADDDSAGSNFLYGLRLTSAATAAGSVGQPFSFQLTANFSDVIFSSTDLPAGLMVSSTGLISGTPSAGGNFPVHITLSRNGRSVTLPMTLNIKGTLRPIEGPTGLTVIGDEQASPVGSNTFYFTGQNGTFSATGYTENPNGTALGTSVTFSFIGSGENWQLRFTAPAGLPLTVGRYEGLNNAASIGPSLTITRGNASSGGPGGYFEIKAIAYGNGSQLRMFDATFEMFTGAGSPMIRGEARCFVDPANPPGTPIVTSPLALRIDKGVPINYQISATNNPVRYKVYHLPAGLSFDAPTATITGVPATTGFFDIVLAAENSAGIGTARVELAVTAPPPPHTLQNIATRLFVGTDADVAIAGVILTGNAPKRMVVRAIGPALSGLGVNGVLPDPELEMRNGNGELMGGNNSWLSEWESAHESGLPPSDRNEAALVRTISPGSSTAIMKGAGAGSRTGVGLIEVYDLDPTSGSRFANISTRGRVKTGENVMIGGFIIGGGEPTRIVVRGMGPSLTFNGVAGALVDPVLALHDSQGAIIQNDNWRERQEEAIIATGLAPSDPREAALLITLPPGNYTAILSEKNGVNGVGLIEVYNLDAN